MVRDRHGWTSGIEGGERKVGEKEASKIGRVEWPLKHEGDEMGDNSTFLKKVGGGTRKKNRAQIKERESIT